MAQLVSASGLGPEGPVFESQYPDEIQKQLLEIQVVALEVCRGTVTRTQDPLVPNQMR